MLPIHLKETKPKAEVQDLRLLSGEEQLQSFALFPPIELKKSFDHNL